jgi:succinate dehydrogenase/fumarate reductase cytochrome b subunit
VLVVLFALTRMLFPASVAAAVAAVRALPAVALGSLAVIFALIIGFEIILGLWLLVKGVRIPDELGDRA